MKKVVFAKQHDSQVQQQHGICHLKEVLAHHMYPKGKNGAYLPQLPEGTHQSAEKSGEVISSSCIERGCASDVCSAALTRLPNGRMILPHRIASLPDDLADNSSDTTDVRRADSCSMHSSKRWHHSACNGAVRIVSCEKSEPPPSSAQNTPFPIFRGEAHHAGPKIGYPNHKSSACIG